MLSVSLARQTMEADGIRGDKQLLGALIRALGAGGLVDEAHAVFRTMARPAWLSGPCFLPNAACTSGAA